MSGYTQKIRTYSRGMSAVKPEAGPSRVATNSGKKKVEPTRFNNGHVRGVRTGMKFATLHELHKHKVHGRTGRFHITENLVNSVILGGMDDDNGNTVTVYSYTRKCVNWTKVKRFMAFVENIVRKKPVRVIRSSDIEGHFTPLKGYRFDGLYTVKSLNCRQLPDNMYFWIDLERIDKRIKLWDEPSNDESKPMGRIQP